METEALYTPPEEGLEAEIAKIWSKLLQIDHAQISAEANYFQLGGNSLSVVKMISEVKGLTGVALPLALFWKAPTIRGLAKLLGGVSPSIDTHLEKIKRLIAQDLELPERLRPKVEKNPLIYAPKKIFLTGATGFLGSYLLRAFAQMGGVEIYCLVRACSPSEAKERIYSALAKIGMEELASWSEVRPVCGDLALPNLGLSADVYAEIAESIDLIYHNGALVHHLYDYERMRATNVGSTHEILKLAVAGKNKAIHFISTVSVEGFDVRDKLKTSDSEWSFTELNGYLLTKWVSEQILFLAAKRGVAVSIYRPGNITGDSKTGFCIPELNHTLRKIKGFIQLGQAYFDEREPFEMTPVDILAKEIARVSLTPHSKSVFKMVNPARIPFSAYVKMFAGEAYPLERVSCLGEWQGILSKIEEDNALYPLRGYYDHYEELLDTEEHHCGVSSLALPIPGYEELIAKQREYLQLCGFVQENAVGGLEEVDPHYTIRECIIQKEV